MTVVAAVLLLVALLVVVTVQARFGKDAAAFVADALGGSTAAGVIAGALPWVGALVVALVAVRLRPAREILANWLFVGAFLLLMWGLTVVGYRPLVSGWAVAAESDLGLVTPRSAADIVVGARVGQALVVISAAAALALRLRH